MLTDAGEAIRFYELQGIKIKIISGDHPQVVAAIAQAIGISIHGECVIRDRLT